MTWSVLTDLQHKKNNIIKNNMEIPKTYEPRSAEERWYSHWMAKGYFHSEPDDRELRRM